MMDNATAKYRIKVALSYLEVGVVVRNWETISYGESNIYGKNQ